MRNLTETPDGPPLRLNPQRDSTPIAQDYRDTVRVHVPDFFDVASAARIHRALAKETPWQVVLYDGAEHRDLPEADRAHWKERAYRAAVHEFSCRYANFRLYENRERDEYRELWLMRQRPAGAAVS